jgi:RNA polymerase sigma-70 factor (ECF subfamily)
MTDPATVAGRAEATPVAEDVHDENLYWLTVLRGEGPEHHEALTDLWYAVRRAAQTEIARRPDLRDRLGQTRVSEIVDSATDEATAAVLRHLDDFEGRSRFLTWAYKFGVNHAYAETRRALWRDRPVELDEHLTQADPAPSPAQWVQAKDLAGALSVAIDTVLTPHQRAVALAIIVQGVPIDVLAERLGTNRNALYKTVHDARRRLRVELRARGYLDASRSEVHR